MMKLKCFLFGENTRQKKRMIRRTKLTLCSLNVQPRIQQLAMKGYFTAGQVNLNSSEEESSIVFV